jgi:hypothetical protein
MDAINHLLTLRSYGPKYWLADDVPKNQDEAYWERLDDRLLFYYNATYPGPDMPKENPAANTD